jgi:hypothetical protein
VISQPLAKRRALWEKQAGLATPQWSGLQSPVPFPSLEARPRANRLFIADTFPLDKCQVPCARLPLMPLILILVVLLLLFGGGGYYMGPGVGYYGGGGFSLVLLIVILYLVFGRGRGRI